MKVSEFARLVKKENLPVSQGYDLASFMLDTGYSEILASPDSEIPDKKALEVLACLRRGVPAAYITGRREFYGIEFSVCDSVLIPRVETETLVDEVLKFADAGKEYRILDLCAGSGCILLALVLNLEKASGKGIDISPRAVEIARVNASKTGAENRVSFEEGDAARYCDPEERYDLVTCNPPYVSSEEYVRLERQVKAEPALALVAPEKGLFFYKKILRNGALLCKKDGAVFFEIPPSAAPELEEFAAGLGITVRFAKDLAGRDRVMICGHFERAR